MIEVVLEGLSSDKADATVQRWLLEEGDPVEQGDDVVEMITEGGVLTVQSPAAGILSEVYYDEGEIVQKGEVLCAIDDEELG